MQCCRPAARIALFRFGTKILTNNGRQSRRQNLPVAILLFADPHSLKKSPTFSNLMGDFPHNTKILAATLMMQQDNPTEFISVCDLQNLIPCA